MFLELRNCRIIRRFGREAQLAVLAKKGPQRDTQLLEMTESESVSAGIVSRAIPADPEAWSEYCPKPEEN
jgi:hypothetical protein